MDATIVVATVGVVGTLLAAVITTLLAQRAENEKWKRGEEERKFKARFCSLQTLSDEEFRWLREDDFVDDASEGMRYHWLALDVEHDTCSAVRLSLLDLYLDSEHVFEECRSANQCESDIRWCDGEPQTAEMACGF